MVSNNEDPKQIQSETEQSNHGMNTVPTEVSSMIDLWKKRGQSAQEESNEHPLPMAKAKEKKGLEFMPERYNVAYKYIELVATKQVTINELNLLKVIEVGTAGAQNSKGQFSTLSEFYLEDISKISRLRINKVYVYLKSLEKKKLIIRKSTRSKGKELIGLNPDVWGQVLINQEQEKERKRELLKLVPKQDHALSH